MAPVERGQFGALFNQYQKSGRIPHKKKICEYRNVTTSKNHPKANFFFKYNTAQQPF